MEFGQALEAELHHVEGKSRKQIEAKMENVMRAWLDMPLKYRTPIATAPPTRTTSED